MKKIRFVFLFAAMAASIAGTGIYAQDFGFGFDDAEADTGTAGTGVSALPVSAKVSGEIAAQFLGYVHDFKDNIYKVSLGDMISGSLNFSASGSNADVYIGLNLSAAAFSDLGDYDWGGENYHPFILDEAYVRGYFGAVNIEAGLRKLTWGKADSLGPLDIVNPLDYSDLTRITDVQAIKIARPMVHLSWNTGAFSKLEAVFIPNFAGHRFAQSGRWTPSQYGTMASTAEAGIFDRAAETYPIMTSPGITDFVDFDAIRTKMMAGFAPDSVSAPPSNGLEYFQSGLRFTTTIGPADIGAQYYYGHLFRPGFYIAGVDDFLDDLVGHIGGGETSYEGEPSLLAPQLNYTRYHQIGIDYAQVLFGFNVRAEFAAHLTEDLKGTDGSVQNPFLAWSLGFDRDLFWGINLNVQGNETIRLLDNKVNDNPVMDCEGGTDMTATRLTARISKKFLRDNLETSATAIWDIEAFGFYIIPAIVWTIGDITSELSAGIFAGEDSGELGQYWGNTFVKLGMKYSF